MIGNLYQHMGKCILRIQISKEFYLNYTSTGVCISDFPMIECFWIKIK